MANLFEDILGSAGKANRQSNRSQNLFGDILGEPGGGAEDDFAPRPEVMRADLPWREVAKRAVRNIPASAFQNVVDVVSILQPAEGVFDFSKEFRILPKVQDLGRLVAEIGGKAIGQETPMLDAALDYYAANYGMGPEGIEGFKRFVAEDPVGLVTDVLTIASLGAGAAAKGGKIASAASKGTRFAAKAEKFLGATGRVNRVVNRGFAIPAPLASTVERVPIVGKRVIGDIRLESGAVTRGVQLGVSEILDPGALALRGIATGIQASAAPLAPFAGQVRQDIIDIAEKHGIPIPASAASKSPAVATAEAILVHRGDPIMLERFEAAAKEMNRVAAEIENAVFENTDPFLAGEAAVRGFSDYRETFRKAKDEGYAQIEGIDNTVGTLENTAATLAQIQEETDRASRLLGRGTIPRDIRLLTSQVDEALGVEGLPETVFSQPDVAQHVVNRAVEGTAIRNVFGADPKNMYQVKYRVVDLNDLRPSQLDNGSPNPDFPPELQPRDRTRISSTAQVDRIAAQLVPDALLADVPLLDRGSPIIGPDLAVESGNGRVLAMRRAARVYPERMEAYQAALRDAIGHYGIDSSELAGMEMPVLVRERLSDVDRVAFVREGNSSAILRQSAAETAANDANVLSDELLAEMQVTADIDPVEVLKAKSNRELIDNFLAKLPANERAELADKAGNISQQGLRRLTDAMLRKTYGGVFGSKMAEKFIESADGGIKNIQKSILAALPDLARSEAWVRLGLRDENLTIAEDVAQAVVKLEEIRREGSKVEDFLAQQSFIYDDLSDTARQLLPFVADGVRAPKKLRQFLSEYAGEVMRAANPQQAEITMFVSPSKTAIVANLLGKNFDDAPDISDLIENLIKSELKQGDEGARVIDEVAEAANGGQPKVEQPKKPVTYADLKATRTKIGEKVFAKERSPIVSQNERMYTLIYDALSADMDATVVANHPELRGMIGEINDFYRRGKQKINSEWGKRILKAAPLGEDPSGRSPVRTGGSPQRTIALFGQGGSPLGSASRLADLIYRPSTPVEQVPLIYELIGPEATQQMQAVFVQKLMEKARGADGQWKPNGLRQSLNRFSERQLRAYLPGETVESLNDLADLSSAFSNFAQKAKGSPTGFINDMLSTGGEVAQLINSISWLWDGGVRGVMLMLTSWFGQKAFDNFIRSQAGQEFLTTGFMSGRPGSLRGGIQSAARFVRGRSNLFAKTARQATRATADDRPVRTGRLPASPQEERR